ncbi:hypothetical protein CEXT_376941 [Caerostris extrusa]|uniref:Metallothionein n=1 Tax=Caerostris extrusa TaxID=172846 RepID=A0AAV4WSJ8_CAEEX|nr:hypothetical protein CEXT_376941 [Caerostris extrusa]
MEFVCCNRSFVFRTFHFNYIALHTTLLNQLNFAQRSRELQIGNKRRKNSFFCVINSVRNVGTRLSLREKEKILYFSLRRLCLLAEFIFEMPGPCGCTNCTNCTCESCKCTNCACGQQKQK